jgi:hypothetical protein
MATTGSNRIEDAYKVRGTDRLLPLGGVTSGAATCLTTATVAAGVATFSVSAAQILIDSLPFSLAAGTVSTAALPNGINNLKVYVSPIREVLAVTTLPAVGTPNQEVMLITPAGDFDFYLQDIYRYVGTSWVLRDAASAADLDPNSVYVPETWAVPGSSDFRHLPFNKVVGSTLTLTEERPIMYPPYRGMPPHLPSMSGSYVRYSAAFAIADVKLILTAGAIANPTTDLVITRTKNLDLIL